MTTTEAVQRARQALAEPEAMVPAGQAVRLADDVALSAPKLLGHEPMFVVRSEGYCGHCLPQHLVVGNLVGILYRLGDKAAPIFRCAGHQQLPINLGAS